VGRDRREDSPCPRTSTSTTSQTALPQSFPPMPLLQDSRTEMAHTPVPLDIWGRVFEHLFSEGYRDEMSSEAFGVMQVCTAWKVCVPYASARRILSFWTELPV
jgi:hypothetical protein